MTGGDILVDFEELKRIDTRQIARRLGLELNRQDKVRCFLHTGDKNPSLQVYADGWKCFGCGAHGDGVDLVAQYLNITNGEAVEWVQKEFNVNTPPSNADRSKAEREHVYLDGMLKKVIYRRSDGSKYGVWYHLEGGKWVKGRGNVTPPLYTTSAALPDYLFLT